ncbi:MAG: hypothetical protein ABSG78_24870, partial [Verrucomicrobiota bacterium]
LVKLALPGLQKAQCFHRNTIDFGQLDRGRRRGVTMYQGHAVNKNGRILSRWDNPLNPWLISGGLPQFRAD